MFSLVLLAALVSLALPGTAAAKMAPSPLPLPGGTLDPLTISKYVTPLVIPPEMPKTSENATLDYYEIAVRQFLQQILPAGFNATTVWSYGSVNHGGTFNYPAFTIEATQGKTTQVKWINDLVDANGDYLPHLLPVDQTLHWANPAGGEMGRDMMTDNAMPYTGPVPVITHVHGAHTTQDSDGFPEAWYLPTARNTTIATIGTRQPSTTRNKCRCFQIPLFLLLALPCSICIVNLP